MNYDYSTYYKITLRNQLNYLLSKINNDFINMIFRFI